MNRQERPPFQPSWRKPVGMLTIMALITAWAVLVGSLSPLIGGLPMLLQVPVYVVLGVIWIWLLPLKRLLAWMETGRWRQ
jgi:predicted membrane channel-forming protein YqfA (hemolysin III family)